METLITETFKDKVYDYTDSKEWNFKGNKPAIIDYFAEWCGPCKAVSPILEELSEKYKGKIDIFKVDIEESYELATEFNIKSIPTMMFIPMGENPQMHVGSLPKKSLEDAIRDVLKIT